MFTGRFDVTSVDGPFVNSSGYRLIRIVGAVSRAVDPTVGGAAFGMPDEAHASAAMMRAADQRVAR